MAKTIYYTLAYPHFIYCNLLWASTSCSNLRPLTIIQKRLIRTIGQLRYRDHTNLKFAEYKILKFNEICKLHIVTYVFKCLNGLIFSPIQFAVRRQYEYNIRNPNSLEIPRVRSTQSQYFALYRGSCLWNSLPIDVRSALTLYSLKRRLKQHFLRNYELNQ